MRRPYRYTRDRSTDLQLLEKEIHEEYFAIARKNGEIADTNSSTVAWGQLPLRLQPSNLAQSDHIPNKWRIMGNEIVDSGGMRAGRVCEAKRDDGKFYHPPFIPYDDLCEEE